MAPQERRDHLVEAPGRRPGEDAERDRARPQRAELVHALGGVLEGAQARRGVGRVVERFLADLHALYPQTRGAIAGATVRRWELGNVYAHPGRSRLQEPLEDALGPHRNLHLAGDYVAALGTMEAAAQSGRAAAERVDARLRETIHA